MKLQTIGRCLDLLQEDYQAKRKAAKEARYKFNNACDAQFREAEARGGIPPIFGPSEDEAKIAEQALADAEAALRDFMSTNWRC